MGMQKSFCIVGDWNCDTTMLEQAGWLRAAMACLRGDTHALMREHMAMAHRGVDLQSRRFTDEDICAINLSRFAWWECSRSEKQTG